MRYYSYLQNAAKIIRSYAGAAPLSVHLKHYFSKDKKYGSRDRKQIAALCYHYYRLGKACTALPVEEKIIVAVFLCEKKANNFLAFHKPDWNERIGLSVQEKIGFLNIRIGSQDIFPWTDELSAGIEAGVFSFSFLEQPDLFLRIRPGLEQVVISKLNAEGIAFRAEGVDSLAFPNGTAIDKILEPDKEAVVQDLNSQQVLNYLRAAVSVVHKPFTAWDCCAASGGKSILLYDILKGKVVLTVSDIRESILQNLKQRFATAGINHYHTFIADLASSDFQTPASRFQILLCDAPCTGSGTWCRTPEQLFFFDSRQIDVFADRQRKIVAAALPALEKEGLFFYITCSVFKKENEEVVEWILRNFNLELLKMGSIVGYDKKADSMFVAVLRMKK